MRGYLDGVMRDARLDRSIDAQSAREIVHDLVADVTERAGAVLWLTHSRIRTSTRPFIRYHERIDGSGYPDRRTGDDVPLHVRLVAIADVYDAIASDRS